MTAQQYKRNCVLAQDTREQKAEADLVARFKDRDPSAMDDLYTAYGRHVYSLVIRMVANEGTAEEIVQEVFLRVWTSAHSIDLRRGCLRAWLLTLTRNLAIDHIRRERNRRFVYTTYDLDAAPVSFEPAWSLSLHSPRIRAGLERLTPNQRAAIEFAYFDGFSQSEIADRMRKPVGTVKTWVRTALTVLRQGFENPYLPVKLSRASADGTH